MKFQEHIPFLDKGNVRNMNKGHIDTDRFGSKNATLLYLYYFESGATF